jgi:hypothetical protein
VGNDRIKNLIFLFSFSFLFGQDFISNDEYGAMLYKNPRGIGCVKCHNKNAKGKIIATYYDKKNQKRVVVAPDITNINWKEFYYRLKYSKVLKKGKFKTLYYSFMPKYTYLTDIEIRTLYKYVKSKKN